MIRKLVNIVAQSDIVDREVVLDIFNIKSGIDNELDDERAC